MSHLQKFCIGGLCLKHVQYLHLKNLTDWWQLKFPPCGLTVRISIQIQLFTCFPPLYPFQFSFNFPAAKHHVSVNFMKTLIHQQLSPLQLANFCIHISTSAQALLHNSMFHDLNLCTLMESPYCFF